MAKKGIDLSAWQADLTDGRILTEAGIEFAILKLSEGRTLKDRAFDAHYEMCRGRAARGAYVYSHAADAAGGRAEAAFAAKLLNGRALELPVFLDLEAEVLNAGKDALMDSIRAFGETIRKAGYAAGVYASLSVFCTLLDTEALKKEGFSLWLAQWGVNEPGMDCDVWQSGSTGRLPGYGGAVDTDVLYADLAVPDTERLYAADMAVLCRGFYGQQVALLQKLLHVAESGVYDRATEAAVIGFQKENGLTADGLAGRQTWERLKERIK